jgi:hypothetical protein
MEEMAQLQGDEWGLDPSEDDGSFGGENPLGKRRKGKGDEWGLEDEEDDGNFGFENPLLGGGKEEAGEEESGEWQFPEYAGEIGWDIALDGRMGEVADQLSSIHNMDNPFFQKRARDESDMGGDVVGFEGDVGFDVGLGEGARRRFSLEDKRLEFMFEDNPMARFREAQAKGGDADGDDGGSGGKGFKGRVSFSAGLDGANSKRRYSDIGSTFFDNPMGTHRGNASRDQRRQLEQLAKTLKKGQPIRAKQPKPLTRKQIKERAIAKAEAEADAEYAAALAEATAKAEAQETAEGKRQQAVTALEQEREKAKERAAAAREAEAKEADEARATAKKADASFRSKEEAEQHKHNMDSTFLKKSHSQQQVRSSLRQVAAAKKGRVAELLAKMQALNEKADKMTRPKRDERDEQERIKAQGIVAARRAKFENLIDGGKSAGGGNGAKANANQAKSPGGAKLQQQQQQQQQQQTGPQVKPNALQVKPNALQVKPNALQVKPNALQVLRQSIQRHSMALQMSQAAQEFRRSAHMGHMGGASPSDRMSALGARMSMMSVAASIREGDEEGDVEEGEDNNLEAGAVRGTADYARQSITGSPIKHSPITFEHKEKADSIVQAPTNKGDTHREDEVRQFDEVRMLNPKSSWVHPSKRRSLVARGADKRVSARSSAMAHVFAAQPGRDSPAMSNGSEASLRYFSESSSGSRSAASSRAVSHSVTSIIAEDALPSLLSSRLAGVVEVAPRSSTRLSTVNMFGRSIDLTIEHEPIMAYEIEHTVMPTVAEDGAGGDGEDGSGGGGDGRGGGSDGGGGSKWDSKLESHTVGAQPATESHPTDNVHGGHAYPEAPPFVQPVINRTYSIVAGPRAGLPTGMGVGMGMDGGVAESGEEDLCSSGVVLPTATAMRPSTSVLPSGQRHQKRTSFARRAGAAGGAGVGTKVGAGAGVRRSGFRNSLMPAIQPENSVLLPPPPLNKHQRMLGSTAAGGFRYDVPAPLTKQQRMLGSVKGGFDYSAEDRGRGSTVASQTVHWDAVFPESAPELDPNSSVFGHAPAIDYGVGTQSLNPMLSQHQMVNNNSALSRSVKPGLGQHSAKGGTIAFVCGDSPFGNSMAAPGIAPPQRVIKNAKALADAKRAKGMMRENGRSDTIDSIGERESDSRPPSASVLQLHNANSLDSSYGSRGHGRDSAKARMSTKSSHSRDGGRDSTKSVAKAMLPRTSSRESTKPATKGGQQRASSRESTKSATSAQQPQRRTQHGPSPGQHTRSPTLAGHTSRGRAPTHALPLLTYMSSDYNTEHDLHQPHVLETRNRCMTLAGVGKHASGHGPGHGRTLSKHGRTRTLSNRDRTGTAMSTSSNLNGSTGNGSRVESRTRGISKAPARSADARSSSSSSWDASDGPATHRNPPSVASLPSDSKQRQKPISSYATAEFQRQHRGMSTAISASDHVILGKDESRQRGMTNLMPFGGRGRGVSAVMWGGGRTRAATAALQNADEEEGREGEDVEGWAGQNKVLASLGRHMFQGAGLDEEYSHGDVRDSSRPRGMTNMPTNMPPHPDGDAMVGAYGRTMRTGTGVGGGGGGSNGWKTHRVRQSGIPVMRDMRSITMSLMVGDGDGGADDFFGGQMEDSFGSAGGKSRKSRKSSRGKSPSIWSQDGNPNTAPVDSSGHKRNENRVGKVQAFSVLLPQPCVLMCILLFIFR